MGDNPNNNATTVGQVVESFRNEEGVTDTNRAVDYLEQVISQSPNSDVSLISSIVTAGGDATLARLATRAFSAAVDNFGQGSQQATQVHTSLAEISDRLTEAFDKIGSNLSPEEAEAFTREFLDHHDLTTYTTANGRQTYYIPNSDEKVAQPGDYIPRPEAFAPGNILEQNQQQQNNIVAPPSPPKGLGM